MEATRQIASLGKQSSTPLQIPEASLLPSRLDASPLLSSLLLIPTLVLRFGLRRIILRWRKLLPIRLGQQRRRIVLDLLHRLLRRLLLGIRRRRESRHRRRRRDRFQYRRRRSCRSQNRRWDGSFHRLDDRSRSLFSKDGREEGIFWNLNDLNCCCKESGWDGEGDVDGCG